MPPSVVPGACNRRMANGCKPSTIPPPPSPPQTDRSLQRMKTDYIDIMQVHSPSYDDLVNGDGIEGLKKAQELGFETIVIGDETGTLCDQLSRPANLLVEASGSPSALAEAGQAVAAGGLVGVVATYAQSVPLPATDLVRAEQRLHMSFGASRNDFDQAIAHIKNGDIPVDDLVDTYALEAAVGAFDDSIAKTTQKAVLIPPH